MAHTPATSSATLTSNPWGCPPALCSRQHHLQHHVLFQFRHAQSRSAAIAKICSCQHVHHITLQQQQQQQEQGCRDLGVPALMSAQRSCPSSLQKISLRCSTVMNFASAQGLGSSFSSSSGQQQQLMPFPAMADPQQQLLCDILRLEPSQAQLILLSCPEANSMTQQQLTDNWQELQQLLPLPQRMLLQAVLQVPSLLPQPQQTITARLADSARVLGVPAQRLRAKRREQTVQLHWQLLVTPQQRLEQHIDQLMQLLGGLPRQHVVLLVCAEPRLLNSDPAQLLSNVEALEQICGCKLGRLLQQLRCAPRLLVSSADTLYKAAAGLQQMLRLSEEGLTLVVRRAPAALIVPSGRLADLLTALPAALSVSKEVAVDILLQEPELLVRSPGAVLAVLTALRTRYRLNTEALLQVVEFDPSILLLSSGQLAEEAQQFRLAASSHPVWQAEYKYLMSKPVNVARALRIEPLRLQRLVFLTRQGLAGTINLRAALTLSGRKFVGLFPKYPTWLARVYSGGNAPKRYAAVGVASSHEEDSEDESDY